MLEYSVTQNLVDHLPVARNQALLVKVDEVALDLLGIGFLGHSTGQIIANLIALHLFERVAECLKLLELALTQQLLNDLGEQVDVAVFVVEAMLFSDKGGQLRLFITLLSADDD